MRQRLAPAAAPLIVAAVLVIIGAVLLAGGSGAERPASSVEDPHPAAGGFRPDGTKLDGCAAGDRGCQEQAFANVAYREGPKPALALFRERMAADTAIEANCHRIAHYIGSGALSRLKGDVAAAFAAGDATCASGYYHGILERAFRNAPRKSLGAVAKALCADGGIRRTAFLAFQCLHGLGHGLMIKTGYDLPDSLQACDALGPENDVASCAGGVFMENAATAPGSPTRTFGTSRWLKEDDLIYPCETVAERHEGACYLLITSRILAANKYDWKDTARHCAKVEDRWVDVCFQSYGRDASGVSRQDPVETARLCRLAGSGRDPCLFGAARDMVNVYSDVDRAAELCGAAPAAMRERCFYGIGSIVGALTAAPSERQAFCDRASTRYSKSCMTGAAAATA